MRIAVFASKAYDRRFLDAANAALGHELTHFEARLDAQTASLAAGFPAVCVFVNDRLDADVLERLAAGGTRLVLLRCAGYNNVDLKAAARLGVEVARVPAYSPHAVAEFTVALMLAHDRRIPRAWARVRDNNFALDGLIGRNLRGRSVGVIGTGRIGSLVARILLQGFGCRVMAHDPVPDPGLAAVGVEYRADARAVLREADIVTLHCPLTPDTRHLVDAEAIERARPGVLLVNTSRGALVDTRALVGGLKTGKVGGVALDVYEQEADLFFEDLSNEIVQDDVFQRLLTFPNVLVTGHQAFLTEEALGEIARATLANAAAFEAGRPLGANRVDAASVQGDAPRPEAPAPVAEASVQPLAAVRGWHAHVYYDPHATRDIAERLRRRIGERFVVRLGRWHDVPVGPHAAAMYQVAFEVAQFASLVPWLALNREGLSVLVHPDTLAPRADHLRHALWLGAPLPLKGEVLPEASGPDDEPAQPPNTAPTLGP